MSIEHDEAWLEENYIGDGHDGKCDIHDACDLAREYHEHMKAKEADQLAEKIADQLFVNGNDDKAARLVLELENGKDGGGWSKQPVIDLVRKVVLPEVAG